MQNLLALDQTKLAAWFQAELGEPAFRARQVMQWIYQKGVRDFAQMSDISKTLRAKLETHAEVRLPALAVGQHSNDGTRKWVLKLDDPKYQAIETVFIPEDDRGTLCISSQVGCAMDCQFCSTAVQGFSRNLSTAEIIGQVWWASDQLRAGAPWSLDNRPISNVVFMGMGEPLANFEAVLTSLNILLDDFAFGLSKRKVTISTAGLVPFIDRLRERTDCALAVSLHAANDELRDEIVPLNRKYPIAELMAACDRYTDGKDRKIRILYEYVMLAGVNDRPEHARQLAQLLADRPAKVNLIPFNPFPGAPYQRSSNNAIHNFRQILTDAQITNTVRKTRGDDIDAACGQLVGKVQSRQRQTLSQRK